MTCNYENFYYNSSKMQQGNSDEFIKALRKGVILIACRVCGQVN
jgi:hypothetical protein